MVGFPVRPPAKNLWAEPRTVGWNRFLFLLMFTLGRSILKILILDSRDSRTARGEEGGHLPPGAARGVPREGRGTRFVCPMFFDASSGNAPMRKNWGGGGSSICLR